MASIPRLHKRPENGIYYCRVAVPKDLVSIIGKREIKVSLQTTNLRVAMKAFVRASYVADCEFMAARGEQPELLIPSIKQGISIKQLTEKYFAAHEQAKLTASTIMEYKIRFRVIMELMGADKPIKTITRQDCRALQQQVLALPPNAYKRFPKMGLIDVIAHAKQHNLEPMAPKTVNQHISCLNLLMEWACRERLLDANPARGLWVEETKLFKDKRDPFSMEQLNAIFNNDIMRSYRQANSARFWVPMLALWTGARLNEICQLMLADIGQEDGVYYIRIADGEGKQVKTVSANRIIPVHPELLKLGFATFVESCRAGSQQRLFAELRNGSRGKPSELFSKWFATHIRAVGAKVPTTCFHSFRHNFRDALREAKIEREIVQVLGGWKDKQSGTEDIYGKGYGLPRLYQALSCIGYGRALEGVNRNC